MTPEKEIQEVEQMLIDNENGVRSKPLRTIEISFLKGYLKNLYSLKKDTAQGGNIVRKEL